MWGKRVWELQGLDFSRHRFEPRAQWEINFGIGWGLSGAADRLIAKMILGYRFNF